MLFLCSKTKTNENDKKELKQLEEIADAFLKARSVYPPDYEGFLLVAGRKQVEQFYMTMHILTAKAEALGFAFDWLFDDTKHEWFYTFSEASCRVDWNEEACL